MVVIVIRYFALRFGRQFYCWPDLLNLKTVFVYDKVFLFLATLLVELILFIMTSVNKTTIYSLFLSLLLVGTILAVPTFSYAEDVVDSTVSQTTVDTVVADNTDEDTAVPDDNQTDDSVVTDDSSYIPVDPTESGTDSDETIDGGVVAGGDVVSDNVSDMDNPVTDSSATTTEDILADEPTSDDASDIDLDTPAPEAEEDTALPVDNSTNEVISDEVGAPTDEDVVVDENSASEGSFDTTSDDNTVTDEVVSSENNFNTESDSNSNTEVVSSENTFTTDADGGCTSNCTEVDEVVSTENTFTTNPTGGCTSNCTEVNEVVSPENTFTTNPTGGCTSNCGEIDEVVSNENTFTTNPTGGCTSNCTEVNEVVSQEVSFTTSDTTCTGDCGEVNEVVSNENTFTTDSNGGGGGGCTSNCGGGGGGGHPKPKNDPLPLQCPLYLKTYMRLGYNNDAEEVRKLQLFLRVFENFDIPVTGVYDQVTENAVRTFQNRYDYDVLDPWGIDSDTGYAYITTTLKINYIYCGITAPITLDLRDRFPGLEIGPGGLDDLQDLIDNGLIFGTTSTTTLPEQEGTVLGRMFNAAAVGLLDSLNFLWENICALAWLLILILLAIIAWLLYRLRELKQEVEDLKQSGLGLDNKAIGLVDLADLSDDEDMEGLLNGDGWQEYAGGDDVAVDPNMAPLPIIEAGDSEGETTEDITLGEEK